MAEEHRTSLGAPIPPSAEEPEEQPGTTALPIPVPERGATETMRALLPAIEPERRVNDWSRVEQTYTYEREVEEFLRWSPYVRREHPGERGGVAADREPLGI